MKTLENGMWAGTLATGPMTLAMFALQNSLPEGEKSPLPPATLSSQMAKSVGLDKKLGPDGRANLAMLSHFGYGMAAGVLYSSLQKHIPGKVVAKGCLFGLGVWAASYAGWTPLMGMRASAPKMPPKRNALMILAHLVWGTSLAYAESELRKSGRQMLDGHNKKPDAE